MTKASDKSKSKGAADVAVARENDAVFRVNARFDAAHADRLAFLVSRTGLSTSDVLRTAVDRLFTEAHAEEGRSSKYLGSLIGKFDGGPRDLASNYKSLTSESLGDKHGHR